MECKHKRICEVMAGLGDVEILEASEPLDGALLVEVYQIQDPGLADEYTRRLAADLQDQSCPPEVNQLGRAIARWYTQIVARRPLPGVERTHRSSQQSHPNASNESGSGSATSPTTGSEHCSTQANPTGTYSPR